MKRLITQLKNNDLTISFAESMTGGMLSSRMSKISGASKVFNGAVVAYTNEVKTNLLKVKKSTIEQYSVVSKEVSVEMVEGLRNLIKSDIYISVTGNAGPTKQAGTDEFRAFFTIAFLNEIYTSEIKFNSSNRISNIKKTINLIEKNLLKTIS